MAGLASSIPVQVHPFLLLSVFVFTGTVAPLAPDVNLVRHMPRLLAGGNTIQNLVGSASAEGGTLDIIGAIWSVLNETLGSQY